MTTALITRPATDAEPLAALLEARGVTPLVAPLIEIVPKTAVDLDLTGVQALLFTSANGVRVFAGACAKRDIGAFAVGDATARAAMMAGFAVVIPAGGDVAALAETVVQDAKPDDGTLMHIAGSDVAGDLAGALTTAGFTVRRHVLYEARETAAWPPSVVAALRAGSVSHVLVYSPRTAELLVKRLKSLKLQRRLSTVTAVCLSPAVAEVVAPLAFGRVAVAATPDQDSVLALVAPAELGDPVADPTPSEPTQAVQEPPVPAKRSAPSPWLAGIVGALVTAAIIIATSPSWLPLMVPAPDLGPLERRLTAVERGGPLAAAPPPQRDTDVLRRLEALERASDRPAASTPAVAPAIPESLLQRLSALEAPRPAAPTVDLSPIEARIGRLAEQLTALQDRQAETSTNAGRDGAMARRAAQALAVAQLADAVGRGAFQPALATALAVMDGETRSLAQTLEAHAAGVPTVDQLVQSFGDAALLAKKRAAARADVGWFGEVRAFLATLVVIRRTGTTDIGDDLDSRLTAAEARLLARDLAGALAVLAPLPAEARDDLGAWLKAASARVTMDQTVSALSQRVLRGLAGG
jgi:uroporphyrinogen-III synthase